MKHYLSIFFQKYSDIEAKDETLAHMIYSMAATLFLCVGILISLAVKCYSAFRSKKRNWEEGTEGEEHELEPMGRALARPRQNWDEEDEEDEESDEEKDG